MNSRIYMIITAVLICLTASAAVSANTGPERDPDTVKEIETEIEKEFGRDKDAPNSRVDFGHDRRRERCPHGECSPSAQNNNKVDDSKLDEISGNEETINIPEPSGTSQRDYSWYCKHRDDGKQPECDAEMRFIEDYGGYYIDRSHSNPEDAEKVIYLTFDAGYENGNIAKILDVLKEEEVHGAFFILENLITHDTELVKRMTDEGHTVCNHTASHKDMSKITDINAFREELEKLEKTYTEYTGAKLAAFYRPPEGRFSKSNLEMAKELGYNTIMWSFAYADWDNNSQMNAESAKKKVLSGTHNGEILLLHPTSTTNAAILKDLITEWKNMGYRFGTLEELVSVDSTN